MSTYECVNLKHDLLVDTLGGAIASNWWQGNIGSPNDLVSPGTKS